MGNVCYLAEVDSAFSGLPASNLFFAVSNSSTITYPTSSTVELGVGASVSLMNGSSVAGVWSYTRDAWSIAPSGDLPTTEPIVVVLDTGLTTNSTFVGSGFYVEHSLPYGGLVEFPLY
jgi:hypothetical protein